MVLGGWSVVVPGVWAAAVVADAAAVAAAAEVEVAEMAGAMNTE